MENVTHGEGSNKRVHAEYANYLIRVLILKHCTFVFKYVVQILEISVTTFEIVQGVQRVLEI